MAPVKRPVRKSYAARVKWHPGMGRCHDTGKRCFPNRAKARVEQRIRGLGGVYRCSRCDKYHITSYPPNVMRAILYLLRSLTPAERRLWRGQEKA